MSAPAAIRLDSLKTRTTLTIDGKGYTVFSLPAAEASLGPVGLLPKSLKVLLENLLRYEDGRTVTEADIRAIAEWQTTRSSEREINYRPARVLMQDFTGVPGVVDLASMREAFTALGGDPTRINPLNPVDLVIDHSVMVDAFGSPKAFQRNVELEFERNLERYQFLRWGSQAFRNFRVVPPGTGICHQVNLEYLAQTVWTEDEGAATYAFPDTLVGTDSHTTMVNGMAVLGWGVGGIEAEAAMLGQPISMLIPEVVGFHLSGTLPEGTTATDLVLTVTNLLRKKGVVGKFVEFYGPGVSALSLADRATIANMAPEYGATCGFFPIDAETLRYLEFTGRDPHRVRLVEAYAKAQGLWLNPGDPDPVFTDTLSLDLGTVEPSLAGPRRPQDRVALSKVADQFTADLPGFGASADRAEQRVAVPGTAFDLAHGDVVIAAITSCTNTSNPSVLVAAGLVAQKALEKGLSVKPWVKTSLAPGSQVVTDYLARAGLQEPLDRLGFHLVGYGCTTCIGNSGPLAEPIEATIEEAKLVVASVLSGNRNFEGRVSPHVRANYLASPPLVVAYALAGTVRLDLSKEPIGTGSDGQPVYLKDIWPSSREIQETIDRCLTAEMFRTRYGDVFKGPAEWQEIRTAEGQVFDWDPGSTYIRKPSFFDGLGGPVAAIQPILGARCLLKLGDSITTDHISPAGDIARTSPAAQYLSEFQILPKDYNSYGSRRGNHEVMMRGTFANIRLKNQMLKGIEGGVTIHLPTGQTMSVYDAAMRYKAEGTPLIVLAGKEYGTGSSRDWAAKGTNLLGIRAVIAESFERIHRSNLVGMGVLPLQFLEGQSHQSLGLTGEEVFDILGLSEDLEPRQMVTLCVVSGGEPQQIPVLCRIDTANEVDYYRAGGVLQFVLRQMLAADRQAA